MRKGTSLKYKTKNYFMLKEVAGDYVVIARGPSAIEFNGVLILNESCALLWKHLQDFTAIEKMAEILRDEYSIDLGQALADVEKCINKMNEYNLLDFEE